MQYPIDSGRIHKAQMKIKKHWHCLLLPMVCTPLFILIISNKHSGIFSAILAILNNHFLCSIAKVRILNLFSGQNAQELQLLVIGRHEGGGEIRDVLFGSVANYVLHNVRCPVLLF
jgi:hypothetical protein